MEYARSAITLVVIQLDRHATFLAAKWLSAHHLCCVQAAQRPLGLGLDTYNSNYAQSMRCNTGSDGLHRMDDTRGSRLAQVLFTERFISQIGHYPA